jgi:hypothetical protein
VRKWIKKAKIVFTSSMGSLFTPANWGVYVSTKHALESVAQALRQELEPYGIKVQTINPGPFYTGYNETMADALFRWLDDSKHVTKRAALRREFDSFLKAPDGHLDAREMIDRMIEIVPADTGKFRNVVPKATEDMLNAHQLRHGRTRSDLMSVRPPNLSAVNQPSARSRPSGRSVKREEPHIARTVVTMGALWALMGCPCMAQSEDSIESRNKVILKAGFKAWPSGAGSPL